MIIMQKHYIKIGGNKVKILKFPFWLLSCQKRL